MGIKTSRLTVPASILYFKIDGYHSNFAIKRSKLIEYDTLINHLQVGDTILLTHDYIPHIGLGMNDQIVDRQKGNMIFNANIEMRAKEQ